METFQKMVLEEFPCGSEDSESDVVTVVAQVAAVAQVWSLARELLHTEMQPKKKKKKKVLEQLEMHMQKRDLMLRLYSKINKTEISS